MKMMMNKGKFINYYERTAAFFDTLQDCIKSSFNHPYMPVFNYLGNGLQLNGKIQLNAFKDKALKIIDKFNINPDISYPAHQDQYYVSFSKPFEFISVRVVKDEINNEITVLAGTGQNPNKKYPDLPLFNPVFTNSFSSDNLTDKTIDWLKDSPVSEILYPMRTVVAILTNYSKKNLVSAQIKTKDILLFIDQIPFIMESLGFTPALRVNQKRMMIKMKDHKNLDNGGTDADTWNISIQACQAKVYIDNLKQNKIPYSGDETTSFSIIETRTGTSCKQVLKAACVFNGFISILNNENYLFTVCRDTKKIQRIVLDAF